MLKRYGKRALASLLTLCMLLGLVPGLEGLTLWASATDSEGGADTSRSIGEAFNFKDEIPDTVDLTDLNNNPYGKQAGAGKWVNFNPVKELNIFQGYRNNSTPQTSNVYTMDENSYDSWFSYQFDGFPSVFTQSGESMLETNKGNGNYTRFVNGVAFDPTGSGRDSYVAYYGFDQNNSFRPELYVADANDPTKFNSGWVDIGDSAKNYNAQKNINYASYKGYTSIVAGDFDGTGEDTLVLYHNSNGRGETAPTLELREFKVGQDDSSNTLLSKLSNLFKNGSTEPWTSDLVYDISEEDSTDSTVLAGYFGTSPGEIAQMSDRSDGERLRNTVMVQLAAGDVDGDNADELIATVSLPNLVLEDSKNFSDRSSVVMVLEKNGDKWDVLTSWQLTDAKFMGGPDNSKSYNGTGGWFMRSASSYVGDVDGDNMAEVVSAGFLFDDRNHRDDDMDGDAEAAITIADCANGGKPTPRRTPVGGSATALTAWRVDMMRDALSEWKADASEGPISLALAALEGTGTREYAVVHGELFLYVGGSANGNDGSFTEREIEKAEHTAMLLDLRQRVTYPVVGNFDGNQEGREQVFMVTFYPGVDQECLVSFGVSEGQSPITAGELNSNNVDMGVQILMKANNGYFVALTAPDVDDDDGLFVQMKEKLYEFSDVEVMAVLEATPYFGNLAGEYGETLGGTGFGVSKGQGGGTTETASTSAGIYVAFEQEIAFVATMGSAEMETAVTSEWSEEVSTSTEYEYDIDFDAGRDSHEVVLVRTPVMVYDYYVWDPATNKSDTGRPERPTEEDNLSTMHISQAQQPAYTTMPLEEYNALAAAYGKTDEQITTLSSIPGEPASYRKDYAGLNAVPYGSFASTGSGTATVTQSIDKGKSQEITTSQSHSISVSAGGGAFGFVIGATGETSSSTARSVTSTESVTRAATVANIPSDYSDNYGFQWQMITYDINLKSGADSYSVPVVGYVVQDVNQPPSLPTNITATPEIEKGKPVVELSWTPGYVPAAKYEIYRYLETDNTGIHYYRLGTVSGTDNTFTHAGSLTEGTEYKYCIRAVGSNDKASTYSAPVSVITLKNDGTSPVIQTQPIDQTASVGETATFTISASPGKGSNSVNYGWQKRVGDGGWEPLENTNDNTLKVANVTKEMSGTQYRCLVSNVSDQETNVSMVYSKAVTLTVEEETPKLTLTQSSTSSPAADTTFTTTDTKQEQVSVTYKITIDNKEESYLKYTNGVSGGQNQDIYVSGGKYYIIEGLPNSIPEPVIDATNKTATVTTAATGKTELRNLSGMLTQKVDNEDVLVANVNDLHSTVIQTEVINDTVYQCYTATGVALDVGENETFPTGVTSGRLNLYQPTTGSDTEKYFVLNGTGELQEVKIKTVSDTDGTPAESYTETEDGKENITDSDNNTYLQNTLAPVYATDKYVYVDASGVTVESSVGAVYAKLEDDKKTTVYQKLDPDPETSGYYGTGFNLLTAIDEDKLGTCEEKTLGSDEDTEGTKYMVVTQMGSLGIVDTVNIPVTTTGTTMKKGTEVKLELDLTPPRGEGRYLWPVHHHLCQHRHRGRDDQDGRD